MKVLITCSSGGHLAQAWALRPWWEQHERTWVTHPTEDARHKLAGEHMIAAHYPTVRNLPNLARNSVLARRLLDELRPDVVLSTGAAVAVPFFVQARRRGIRTVHLEPVDRIHAPSLTGKLLFPFSDRFFVQWPSLQERMPGSEYVGLVL